MAIDPLLCFFSSRFFFRKYAVFSSWEFSEVNKYIDISLSPLIRLPLSYHGMWEITLLIPCAVVNFWYGQVPSLGISAKKTFFYLSFTRGNKFIDRISKMDFIHLLIFQKYCKRKILFHMAKRSRYLSSYIYALARVACHSKDHLWKSLHFEIEQQNIVIFFLLCRMIFSSVKERQKKKKRFSVFSWINSFSLVVSGGKNKVGKVLVWKLLLFLNYLLMIESGSLVLGN